MPSLIFLILFQVVSVLLLAFAMQAVARWRKDPPNSIWRFLGVMLFTAVINLFLSWIILTSMPETRVASMPIGLLSVACSSVAFAAMVRLVLGFKGNAISVCMATYVVGALLVIAFAYQVMRPYLIETFSIPTDSMAPTIITADRVVADKMIAPRRWDVVVFHPPNDPNINYIKRVVVLPGETFIMKDGAIWINGHRETPPEVVANVKYGRVHEISVYAENKDEIPATMAVDEYFLIGDNVERSFDSRYFGPVKRSALVGVAEWTYWPISRWRLLR